VESSLSLIVVDLVLQQLESQTINNLSFKPIFYFKFVDDIALIAPNFYLKDLLDKFNSFHSRLMFTMKVGDDKLLDLTLNFLDLTLIKRNSRLIFNWYQKLTFSGQFLNFQLQLHPFLHKKDMIINLIDRVIFFILS